ncbi:hypothetical protein OG818_25680 [Streptomyces virginiae]|uniref:hypothetical protein n=1 Tax=Streptomyces virginiae TaxID=1961 RepID=UPI00225B078B|nr:hypothetical protein [Streptomyces virginiae]MCX4719137.1 hypothetical protein [Streptomyces virginiae]
MNGAMPRRPRTKKQRPPFGIPREIVLLAGRDDVWPYTFVADGAGGGCGKVAMPGDAAVEDVQAAVFAPLADLARTLHGVEIGVTWSVLTPDAWVGHVGRDIAPADPAPSEGRLIGPSG